MAVAEPQTSAPDDYQRIQTNPNQFGASIGAGLEKLSAGGFDALHFYGQVAADSGTNDLQDFSNKLRNGDPSKMVVGPDGQQQPDTGYLGTKGEDAMKAAPAILAQLDQRTKEIRAGLPTPEAQLQFDQDSRRYRFNWETEISDHARSAQQEWAVATTKATESNARTIAASNPNNPASVAEATDTLLKARMRLAHLTYGSNLTNEIVSNVALSAQQDVTADRVRSLLGAGDAMAAQKVLETNSGILSSMPGFDSLSFSVSSKVDRLQERAAVGMRVSVENTLQNSTAAVERGVQLHTALPTDAQIDASFPNEPERAQIVKDQRDDLQNMNYYLGVLPGATPAQVAKLRSEAAPDPNKPDTYAHQARISSAFDAALNARNKAITTDPAGYAQQTEPNIAAAWAQAQSNPQAFGNYAQHVQSWLGTVGLPASQQNLLPKGVAQQMANDISSDPASSPAKIQQLSQRFGFYWPQVFRDLVQQGKMSPQYQAVGIIPSADASLLARALAEPGKSGKDISALLPEKATTQVVAGIKGDASILALEHSILNSGGSAEQASTIQSSVRTLTYANMVYKGEDQATAQANAVSAFTSQYKFVPNGGARVPADKFDTVMGNADKMLSGLTPDKIRVLGQAPSEQEVGQLLPQLFPGTKITSGFRTPEHNAAVNGVPNSMHTRGGGEAVDFVPPKGTTLEQIRNAIAARGLPATELIDEGTHIHWGWGAKGQGQIFGNLGGPKVEDYIRTLQASPTWITSPNADALWLQDSFGRIVRGRDGQPFAVPFNGPALLGPQARSSPGLKSVDAR